MSISPLLVAAAQTGICALLKAFGITKRGGQRLVTLSLLCAVAGAALTLSYVVGFMYEYPPSTYALVYWLLYYGPSGAAAGQLVALLKWSFEPAPALIGGKIE